MLSRASVILVAVIAATVGPAAGSIRPPLRAAISPLPSQLSVDDTWRPTISVRRGGKRVDALRVSLVVGARTYRARRLGLGSYRADIVLDAPGARRYVVRVGNRPLLTGRIVVQPLRMAGGFDVVAQDTGDLLVADASNKVLRARPDAALRVAARLALPTEVAVDPTGGFAAITNLRTVVHVSPTGATSVIGQFGELGGLTFGRGGVLYVAEVAGNILSVDPQTRAVSRVLSGLARPHGLEARGSELLIAEADAGRVASVDLASGELTTAFGGLGLPIDVTGGHDGTVYIADYGNNRVVGARASGTFVLAGLDRVNGVAVGEDGGVYATQRDSGRLFRIDPATGAVSAFVGPR